MTQTTSESVYSFAALRNRLTVRGTLVAETGLRIGAGRDTDVTSNDLPVLRDALDRPFLPGASLKGVLRAQAEALVRTLDEGQALSLSALEDHQRKKITPLKEEYKRNRERTRNEDENDTALTQAILEASTLIDKTFGAPWLAGRLFLKDALVDTSYWFGQFEVRNGVGISRDTETAARSLLYGYEVVPAGSRFLFELVLENAADWQLGMVWLLLEPWRRGEVQVGGFRTRGLGYVRLVDENALYQDVTDRSVEDVIALLEGRGNPVDDTRRKSWVDAFRDTLTQLPIAPGAAHA